MTTARLERTPMTMGAVLKIGGVIGTLITIAVTLAVAWRDLHMEIQSVRNLVHINTLELTRVNTEAARMNSEGTAASRNNEGTIIKMVYDLKVSQAQNTAALEAMRRSVEDLRKSLDNERRSTP